MMNGAGDAKDVPFFPFENGRHRETGHDTEKGKARF